MDAWCMCSCGSLGFGCVVNRYACATTRAASGVSCMKSSSSSDNGLLTFFARSSFLGHYVLLLLCFGLRCLSSLESDISLYSSQYDMLGDYCSPGSSLAHIFLLIASFCAGVRHIDNPLKLLFLNL
jgi:hypothetical protein